MLITFHSPMAKASRCIAAAAADSLVNVIGRYSRLVPRNEDYAKLLAKRTLTNLDNGRPTGLDLAHQKLAAAVFAAYGWAGGFGG